MSKSLQRGILFSICVALVLALSLTLVFFAGGGDKNISAPQGQVSATAQNTTSYTHGSDIKRPNQTSGEPVGTAEALVSALATSGTYYLTNDITLSSSQVFLNNTFSGTLYGNGYTVSFAGPHTGNAAVNLNVANGSTTFRGSLASVLSGKIYDLTVRMTGNQYAFTPGSGDSHHAALGGLVGQLTSTGVIENVYMDISGSRLGCIAWSYHGDLGYWGGGATTPGSNTTITGFTTGGLVGWSMGGTINNVTVEQNAWLEAGIYGANTDGTNKLNVDASEGWGNVGNLVGQFRADSTINNIRIISDDFADKQYLVAYKNAGIGTIYQNYQVTVNNLYYDWRGEHGGAKQTQNNDWSTMFVDSYDSTSYNSRGTVNNVYYGPSPTLAYETARATINGQVKSTNGSNVFFDPTTTDYANSLTVVHDTTNAPVDSENERVYTITGQNNYSATSKEITLYGSYDRVIFRNLSSTASNWKNGENFGYNVTYKDTPIFQIPDDDPILFYEHGYVPADYKAAADSTPITSAEQFMSLFRPNGTVDQSGSYYLTEDIAISGFTGNTFNGTLDGCGHTIYIIDKIQDTYTGPNVGGLVGNLGLGGTIKNVRVVLVDEAGEVSLIKKDVKSNRIGVLVGKVDGGTLENVQVLVESGATLKADMTTAGDDHDMAMGGVVGGTNNATLRGVTMELNGKLDPHGSWTFVGAMAGKIEGTTTFENVVLRGNGTLAGHATNGTGNSGQPVFAGALGVTSISSTSPTQTVTVNGLIYDFDVNLAGTMRDGAAGQSNGSYSCYYILTNNYNDNSGMSAGAVTENAPISQYNGAASYSNVFIASEYVAALEGYAKFRTNGNAPIGGATINTIMGTVDGAAGSDVTAYFNPVDGENDMIFRATGSWMMDDMVQLVGSDGKLYQSAMEIAGDHSSPKLVYAPKGVAATDNVVQLTMPSNVFRPEFGKDVLPLTYNGQEQSFVFTLKLNNADQTPLTEDDFTVTYRPADASTGSLGSNSLPVNAGEYVATIELQNGYKFIAEGQGTETDTYELTVEISPYTVEINTVFDFDATYGEISLNGDVISGGNFSAENLFANHDDLSSTFADIPGIAEITVAAADSSQITASGAGKLPVGSYTVAEIKLDDTNFAATDYVEHLVAFEVTQKSVSAEITINETLPQYYDGKSLTPTVTADHAAAIESGDVSELALKIAVDSAEVDAILNAGTYTFDAELIGADADNYILIPTFKTASGDEIASGEWTVEPYDLRLSWSFDSQNPLEYGDEISNDLIADTEIFEAIPYNGGGEFTGFIDFRVTGATYNGGTEYAPGVAVGTSVTFEVEAILPEIEGFIESNYNVILSVWNSGSASTLVEPRTLEIDYENVVNYMAHLTYGEELSNALLQERFNDSYTYYVSNIYNNESVSFAVTWFEKIEWSGYMNPVDDFTEIVPNTPYYGRVQVAYGVDNYRLPDDANDTYFEFMVWPKELTVTGVTWEAGFDGVFDGKEHSVVVESDLIEGDVYDFVIDITDESGSPVDSVTDAGTYTVTVGADEDNLYYDLGLSGDGNVFTLTMTPYDLANATVTIAESDLVYTGSAITVTPIVKGGENDFTSMLTAVVNGGEAVVNAGDYTITASDTNNSGNFTGEATGTFEVAKKQLKLESLTLSSSTYTGAPITVTGHNFAKGFEPAGGEKPELSIVEESGATVQNARTYTFDVTLKEESTYPVNANYVIATDGAQITATVSPASVTVTAGKNAELGALYGESATAETSRFYKDDFITLSPLPDETFTLSDALTFTVTNSASETISPVDGKYTLEPGTYTVTYTISNIDGANYTLTAGDTLTTTLTVKEGALKLTITGWNNTSPTYNGMAQLPTPVFADSAEIGEKIEEGALVYEVTAKEGSSLTGSNAINAGSYTVAVSIAAGFEEKYELVGGELSTDFTIEQLEVVLKWEAEDDLVYNGKEHTATATVRNKVDDDVVEVTVGLVIGNNNVNVGEFFYEATELTGDDAGNYSLPAEKRQAFEVTPAQKEITWNFVEHATIVYGDSVEDVKKLVNIAALNGTIPGVADPLTFTVSVGNYSATTNAGTEVTFTVSYTLPEGAKTENYNINITAADGNKLTVGKATLTLAIAESASLTKVYDGEAVTPSVTVMFGERELESSEYGAVTYTYAIKDGDTLDAAPADASDNAYTVTANVAESTNFNAATSAAVEFNIARKILTAGNWSGVDGLTYNGKAAAPKFEPEGVLEGDSVTATVTVTGEVTDGQAINAGKYTATAKLEGDDAGNYEFDGVVNVEEFTIARKALTVLGATAEFDFGVIGETTNTYKEQIASWDDAKNKVITGFFGNDTYTLGDIKTADTIQEVVYTDGKLNAGSYYVVYTVGDNYTIGSGVQVGHILLTVKKLSYEISLTYTIDNVVQSGWDGNISFEHDAPITLTFASNALEINDGSGRTHVVTVKYDGDGTLPNVTFTLGGITINKSNKTTTISSVQSMNVVAQITPDDETNHEFTGKTSFNFAVKRNTRVEANEEYFSDLGIPSEYTGSSIFVADISATEAFTVTLGGIEQSGVEVSIAATLNGEPTDSICNAGKYVITATYTTGSEEVVTGTYEFTVEKAKLSFTLESAPSIVYGEMSADVMPEALKAFTATGDNDKSVTGTFAITVGLNENIYSNAGFVKAGSYDFTITFTPDDDNYAELVYNSADNDVKLTVEKKAITPFAISYREVVSEGTTLTLTYAGKDAYANNLDITPNGKFEDDDVEFIDDGDYSAANEKGYTPQIRIYESGDGGNYKLDLSGWIIVVLKKTIEVTVSADSDTYTGSAIKLTASSEEVVEGDVVTFTVSGENVVNETVTNAGTYALTVTLDGEQGGNYEVAGEPSVTIGKAEVDLVWTNEEELNAAVYNGQPYEAEVEVRFNGQIVGSASIKYTSDKVTVTDGKAVNAGSYTAEATFAGVDNFNAATESYDFTIAKMVLYGKWNVASDMDMTYDGTSKAGYATWTWTTEPLNEGDVTVGYKYELGGAIVVDVIDAGNYNVYAVFTDNTGNYDTESGILQGDRFDELTVARRAVTVEWSESVSFTYNGAEQAPTATALNVAQGDSLTLTVTGAKKDVGTYTATVAAASVTGNYVLAEDATVGFTIAPKSIGVAWGTTEFTYNGSAQKPTATATGLVEGDSLTLTVTGAQTNAGDYTATVAAFEQGNYKLESTSTAFTIAKADLTVTPASLEIRERETDVMQAFAEGEDLVEAFAGRISVSGVSGTVRYTVTIAGDNNYDDDGLLTVGAHTFTIDAGDNYNAASVSVTVIATPVVTVIASIEGELVYNGSAFEISYALKEGAPEDVSMDDITVTASVETIVNAGEYTVTFTVAGSNEDYDYVVQDASGNAALTFTIAKRGLDVAEVAEAVYGNLQVSGTLVTGTHTAFVAYNDEEIELIVNVKTAALSRAAAEYLDAGEHEVTIALANENGNFSLNGATLNAETEKMEVQSTLDVAPKSVTVGYTTSSKDYDANGISITLDKFEDMLIEGDDPAVNIYINDAPYTGKVVLDAGDYTVRYESADPNYAFAPVSATFTVAPKRVTPNFDLNTGSGSLQITGGGKLEIEEGEETDIVAAIDNFMQSSGVSEEEMSISVSGDLKLEDMATWAPGTYTVKVTLSGNHSGSIEFTVEVSEKVELPPPVAPELPENPVEAGSGNDWVLPLVIAIVALIDLALLVAIGVAAKKRA